MVDEARRDRGAEPSTAVTGAPLSVARTGSRAAATPAPTVQKRGPVRAQPRRGRVGHAGPVHALVGGGRARRRAREGDAEEVGARLEAQAEAPVVIHGREGEARARGDVVGARVPWADARARPASALKRTRSAQLGWNQAPSQASPPKAVR